MGYKNKGEIDRLREGGGSININTPEDQSAITSLLSAGDALLAVKQEGIYQVKMADQIDPKRSNPQIPNTVQRISQFGSDEIFIGKVLLTANNLFRKKEILSNIDCEMAMVHIVEITKNVSEMRVIADQFAEELKKCLGGFNGKIGNERSFVLPSIVNVDARVREFIQKADHSLRELFSIAKLFYAEVGKGGWESLKQRIDGETDRIDNFDEFFKNSLPFLQQIRNARNAIEHPRHDKQLATRDFSINSDNCLVPPVIELVHPKTPINSVPISDFMYSVQRGIVDIVELMVVFLCARHFESPSGLIVRIIEIPEERRTNPNVRYGFGTMIGNELVPLS